MKLSLSDLDLHFPPQRLFKHRRRVICPVCNNSGQYFCRTCRSSLLSQYEDFEGTKMPEIALPVKTTILYSKKEKLEKSSIQYLFPLEIKNLAILDINEEFKEFPENSVLLMPRKDAFSVSQVDWSAVTNIFLLDCKWNQCYSIMQPWGGNPGKNGEVKPIKNVKVVQLNNYQSSFWRPSCMKLPGCLSTVECLYFLQKELQEVLKVKIENIDDILTFYVNNICIVKTELHQRGKMELRRGKGEIYDDWQDLKCKLELKYGPFPE